jgi:hypothetical protein
MAPDKHCSLSGALLTPALTSTLTVHLISAFAVDRCAEEPLLRWCIGQSGGTPDSLVNYSGARWLKPESGQFTLVRTWCTRQSGAPDQGTLGFFALLNLNPSFNLLLVCVELLCTCRIYLEQTS